MVSTIQKSRARKRPKIHRRSMTSPHSSVMQNRLLGYSAHQTLKYAQSLYEKKKLTTYPRTDSCYIADEDEEMLEELAEELEGFLGITPEDVDDAVPRTRRTVNREKSPTITLSCLPIVCCKLIWTRTAQGEQQILKLIIARTLMAVSKPFRYLETPAHHRMCGRRIHRQREGNSGRGMESYGAQGVGRYSEP